MSFRWALVLLFATLQQGETLKADHRPSKAHSGSKFLLRKHRRKPTKPTGSFPVNSTNALATQTVRFYHKENCKGTSTKFETSSNAFIKAFQPYIRNMGSLKLCGKGTVFYYATPDMALLSLLGHVTRCGEDVTKSLDECECRTLSPSQKKQVESFTVQYC